MNIVNFVIVIIALSHLLGVDQCLVHDMVTNQYMKRDSMTMNITGLMN